MPTKTNENLDRVTHTIESRNSLGLVAIQRIQINENNIKLVM